MKSVRLARGTLLCLLVALVVGCLGRSPESHDYILGRPADVVSTTGEGLSIQLASANLPDYVRRPEMVRRVGASEIRVDSQHRWAGGLEANVLRELGARLAVHLGTPRVAVHPQSPRGSVDFRVDVDFDELVAAQSDAVRLRARWAIRTDAGSVAMGSLAVDEPLASGSADALVQAHEAALDTLARRIARQLSEAAAQPGTTEED